MDQGAQGSAQVRWIPAIEEEAALSILDQLRDTADSRPQHRDAGGEGLVDHQRRVFRPDGRDNQHIHPGVHLGPLLAGEWPAEANGQAASVAAQAGRILWKGVLIAKEPHLIAILGQRGQGLQQHVSALVAGQSAHEAHAQWSGPGGLGGGRRPGQGRLSVTRHCQLVPGEPEADEGVAQGPGGGDEVIHGLEDLKDVRQPLAEIFRRERCGG